MPQKERDHRAILWSHFALVRRFRQKIHLLSARCPRYLIVYTAIFTEEIRAAPESCVWIAAREALFFVTYILKSKRPMAGKQMNRDAKSGKTIADGQLFGRSAFLRQAVKCFWVVLSVLLITMSFLTAKKSEAAEGSKNAQVTSIGPQTGLPLPRFESFKAGEVNLRRGPGKKYMIDWVYARRHLPVEVLAESDGWRLIRDSDGTEGWVWEQLLSGRRYILVTGKDLVVMRTEASEDALALARVEPGSMGRLGPCTAHWCEVEISDYEGWLPRSFLWGLYKNEIPR